MEEKGKKLELINLLGLGLGGAIGTGIFIMMGFGIAQTGRSILAVCAVGCVFMLLAFWYNAAMSSMFVFNSGDYGMRTMLFNPLMTGVNAWNTVIQSFALSSHAIAITGYLVIAIPAWADYTKVLALIILTLAFLATIRGSRFITLLQNAVTGILVIALVLFVVYGIGKVNPGAFFSNADGGFWLNGAGGFLAAISTMSFACMGVSGVVAMAAVTKKPKWNIPFSMLLVTLILAVIYALMAYVAAGVLPYEQVAGANLSVTAEQIMPTGAYMFFLVGGGVCAIGSTLLGTITIFRYPMLQVAEDGWLPAVFKRQTSGGYPYVSYLVLYVVSAFPIVTGMSIDVIVSDIMIPTMLMNLYMNLRCVTLPKKYPEQWEKRSIRMPVWLWHVCCVAGGICNVIIIYNLFINLSGKDAVICVVIVTALVALSILRLKQGAVKAEELEKVRQATIQDALAYSNET
nr:APC family permease [uncultured Oscillibacter sp.]